MAEQGLELTFTESSQALEGIVERFKAGSMSLEDSLAQFEEGVKHLRNCQATLTRARGKVAVLVKTLQADGEVVSEPFAE